MPARRLATGGALSALLLHSAMAQTPVETITVTGTRAIGSTLDQPSTAGSRLGLTPLDTAASVAVISGERVRELGLDSVIDAKTLAPGISSANSPGNGGNLLSARGFSGQNSVKQLYRGLEIYNAGGVVSFPFDPWNVERIEVLSGPASVLYGTGAIGGAVNVVPQMPNMSRFEGRAGVGVGSFKTLHQGISLTGPLASGLGFRIDASHRSSDNWIPRGESDSTAISAALRWDASDKLRFTAAYDYGKQLPTHYLGTPVFNGAPAPGTRRVNYKIADSGLMFEDQWLTLATEWQIAPMLALNNTTYWIHHDRLYRDTFTHTYVPPTASSMAQVRRTNYRDIARAPQRQYGSNSFLRWDTAPAGLKLQALVGLDVNRMHYDREDNVRGGSSLVDALNPVPGNYTDTYRGESRPDYFMTLMQAGVYAEARLEVNSQWSAVAGARHDRYRNRREGRAIPGLTYADLEAVGYNLGVVFKPLPALSLYAQAAAASDPVNSLASIGANQQGFELSDGRQVELGAKAQQALGSAEIDWTLAAYDIRKNKLLTPSIANPAISEQVGSQSSRGVEAAVALHAGRWRLDLNGTVLKPRFDSFLAQVGTGTQSLAGLVPVTVHRRAANLLLAFRAGEAVLLQAALRHVGQRHNNNTNTASMPGYTRLDLGASWQVLPALKFDLRLENATDKVYATQGSTTQWTLGRPRATTLSALYAF